MRAVRGGVIVLFGATKALPGGGRLQFRKVAVGVSGARSSSVHSINVPWALCAVCGRMHHTDTQAASGGRLDVWLRVVWHMQV